MRALVGHFDGACEPRNPGGHAVCGWLWKEGDVVLAQQAIDRGTHPDNTNNDAEYRAALAALKWLSDARDAEHLVPDRPWSAVLRGDSQLVVRQVAGAWACNVAHLLRLRDSMRRGLEVLRGKGVTVTLEWVPREQNSEADALSKSLYSPAEMEEIRRVEAWRKRQRRR